MKLEVTVRFYDKAEEKYIEKGAIIDRDEKRAGEMIAAEVAVLYQEDTETIEEEAEEVEEKAEEKTKRKRATKKAE